jgi:hypothetical protein
MFLAAFNFFLYISIIISILTNAEKEIISILKHKPKVVGIIRYLVVRNSVLNSNYSTRKGIILLRVLLLKGVGRSFYYWPRGQAR